MKHLSLTIVLSFFIPSLHAQVATNVSINPSITYQTIEDFGASDCWTTDYVGRYFDYTNKEQAAKWLFSQKFDANGNPEGIGLSLWRVNIGAGSAEQGSLSGIDDKTRRCYSYLNANGSYDWTKSAGQQYFMQKAKEYGTEHFTLFSNSAPVYFTKNGKAFADAGISGSNLKDDCYDDFAEFLATVGKHFVDNGYNVNYISPVNEPQYDWTGVQEGSPWENVNIANLTKELNRSLQNRSMTTKILLSEAGSWTALTGESGRARDQIDELFNSGFSTSYIGNLPHVAKRVAGHSYWTFQTNQDLTTTRSTVASKANVYELGVTQSEWSMLDAAPKTETGFPASYDQASYMDIALFMAKLIYCDIVNANVSSWSYWTAMAQEQWAQKNRFYLLRLNARGDEYSQESYGDIANGGIVTANPNLWALGNYSFFVRPGYQRINMTGASDINSLCGTAYLSPNKDKIVAVFVNQSYSAKDIQVNLGDDNNYVSSIKRYITSQLYKSLQLEKVHPITSINDIISIPQRAVVTLTFDLSTTGIKELDQPSGTSNDLYSIDGKLIKHNATNLDAVPQGVYIVDGKKLLK